MLHVTTLSVLTIQHRLYDYWWTINQKGLVGKRSWPNRDISASSWRGWWNTPLFQPGFESDTSWTQGYSVNATPTCLVHTMSTVVTFASEERNGLDDISRTGLKGEHNRRRKLVSCEQRHRRFPRLQCNYSTGQRPDQRINRFSSLPSEIFSFLKTTKGIAQHGKKEPQSSMICKTPFFQVSSTQW